MNITIIEMTKWQLIECIFRNQLHLHLHVKYSSNGSRKIAYHLRRAGGARGRREVFLPLPLLLIYNRN